MRAVKAPMGRFTDTAVTLLSLIVVFACVAATDHFEGEHLSAELTAITSGEGLESGEGIIDARLRVYSASVNRWNWMILPGLTLLTGLAIGFGCTTWRWAWLMVFVGLLPVLAMAVALHIDAPLTGAALAAVYLLAGALLATAIARHRCDRLDSS
jgi:hypothetical protein